MPFICVYMLSKRIVRTHIYLYIHNLTKIPPKNKRKSSRFVWFKGEKGRKIETWNSLTYIFWILFSFHSIYLSSCPIQNTSLSVSVVSFPLSFSFEKTKKNGIWPQIIPPCIHFLLLLLSFFHRTAISAIAVARSSLILQSMSYRSLFGTTAAVQQQHQREIQDKW